MFCFIKPRKDDEDFRNTSSILLLVAFRRKHKPFDVSDQFVYTWAAQTMAANRTIPQWPLPSCHTSLEIAVWHPCKRLLDLVSGTAPCFCRSDFFGLFVCLFVCPLVLLKIRTWWSNSRFSWYRLPVEGKELLSRVRPELVRATSESPMFPRIFHECAKDN